MVYQRSFQRSFQRNFYMCQLLFGRHNFDNTPRIREFTTLFTFFLVRPPL